MFEQALFEHIKNNFKINNFNIFYGYGEAGEDVQAPYIIQYSLDMDGSRQVLCCDDDFSDGRALIQWNIYALNKANADYISYQLNLFLSGIKMIYFKDENYLVRLNNHSSVSNSITLNNGIAMTAVSREITYNKKGKQICLQND